MSVSCSNLPHGQPRNQCGAGQAGLDRGRGGQESRDRRESKGTIVPSRLPRRHESCSVIESVKEPRERALGPAALPEAERRTDRWRAPAEPWWWALAVPCWQAPRVPRRRGHFLAPEALAPAWQGRALAWWPAPGVPRQRGHFPAPEALVH